jgi:hypothetical protein
LRISKNIHRLVNDFVLLLDTFVCLLIMTRNYNLLNLLSMMKKNIPSFTLTTVCFVAIVSAVYSCKSDKSKEDTKKLEIINLTDSVTMVGVNNEPIVQDSGIPIYYNMYLTVDISTLFDNIHTSYDVTILNPVEKSGEYMASSKKAMNLGVYAVDLGYARAFEQYQKAASYFSVMFKLSSELGIPEDYFYESSDRFENNLANKDSVRKIANEVYQVTDKYLKDNERGNAAALIIFGGWVEALYLSSHIFNFEKENSDYEYMQRIAEQKYSLNRLMTLLGSFKDDQAVASALVLLQDLKVSYDQFEVDPKNIQLSLKRMNEVYLKVRKLRETIVS